MKKTVKIASVLLVFILIFSSVMAIPASASSSDFPTAMQNIERSKSNVGTYYASSLFIQKFLNTWDSSYQWYDSAYKGKKLTEDGKFGLHTESAVKAFQKAMRLTEDGKVGKDTWKAIYTRLYLNPNDSNSNVKYYAVINKSGNKGTMNRVCYQINIATWFAATDSGAGNPPGWDKII